jgi:hypothetical protein
MVHLRAIRPATLRAVCLLLLPVALGCDSAVRERPSSTPYLQAAVQVGEWLRTQSTGGLGGVVPDRIPDGTLLPDLGSGAAGRALFFAELFAATGEGDHRASAHAAARAALTGATEAMALGLYNGLAGIAAVVHEVARITEDGALREASRAVFHRLAEVYSDRGASAVDAHDVLTGRAGVGLALLRAFDVFGDTVFLQVAERVGDDLLAVAQTTGDGGLRWLRSTSMPLDLPNFSHGTAGVGTFLTGLVETTGALRFRIAALAAAAYLHGIADRRDSLFLVPYGVPNDGYVTAYDIGWAHGPPGTARFHYALWLLIGDEETERWVDAGARTVLASGVPSVTTDSIRWTGPFRIDRRFGTAGAAAFLLDWGLVSEDSTYVQEAQQIVDDILRRAARTESGMYWRLPLDAFQGAERDAVFTGYFYGAAGLGLTLLHLHYAMHGAYPQVRLPDDPFPRGAGR